MFGLEKIQRKILEKRRQRNLNKPAVRIPFCANNQCVLRAKSGRCGLVENCDSFKADI